MMATELKGFYKRGSSSSLVVLLHAYMSSPEKLGSVRRVVEAEFPDADIFIPGLPASLMSMEDPVDIVQGLLNRIDSIYDKRNSDDSSGSYNQILLIGHSLGALLARKLYVCACGEVQGVSAEREMNAIDPRPWAEKVERIILIAGMNRGWRISHHLSLINAVLWTLGSLWGNILTFFSKKPPLIFAIHKGAPFITQLRINWIYMRNHGHERKVGNALTIQLLGSVDDMVSPEDNIDLVSGMDFVYLDVPYSGHANVIEMNDSSPLPGTDGTDGVDAETKPPGNIGEARAKVFREALTKSEDELIKGSLVPSDLTPERQRRDVTDVIFVIHGIRDAGYWTHKVARRIIAMARKSNNKGVIISTETSTYGYFPMLPFLMPSKRKEKVEWLMDQYAEALALYPNAEFSFVGHSNGTYLLTRALQDYPACRFKHVVLAGSVVNTKYNWKSTIARGQVKKVLNYVATADWVVAFFPRAIQMLQLQDLGSAGHDGFVQAEKNSSVEQVQFVKGGHGAALKEENWEAISHFVLTGEVKDPPKKIRRENQSLLVKLPGLVAPVIWILILILVASVYRMIWADGEEWSNTLLTILYSWVIWKVVTVI